MAPPATALSAVSPVEHSGRCDCAKPTTGLSKSYRPVLVKSAAASTAWEGPASSFSGYDDTLFARENNPPLLFCSCKIDADSPARLPQLDDNVDVDDMDDDDFCDAVEQLQPVPVQQLPNPGESYIFVKPQGKDGAGTSNYFYDDNVLSQTTYFDSLSPIAPRATAVATAAMTSSTMPPLDPMLRSISPVGGASSMEGIASSSSLNALGLEAPPKVQWAVPPSPTPSNASVSTMESIVMDRGFTNTDGENNCFLNGVLQLLWHNDKFRQHVQRTEHRNCIGRDQMCVFCQLKVFFYFLFLKRKSIIEHLPQNLFVQLKFTSEDSIPPIAIRTALSILYKSESRFQLRQMDDATECFDAIMTQLHQDQAEETASNRLRRDQFAALRASGDWEARMREHDCDPTCAAHQYAHKCISLASVIFVFLSLEQRVWDPNIGAKYLLQVQSHIGASIGVSVCAVCQCSPAARPLPTLQESSGRGILWPAFVRGKFTGTVEV